MTLLRIIYFYFIISALDLALIKNFERLEDVF